MDPSRRPTADCRAWHSLRTDRAAEIAEAAVILPMLFMLLLSIYWFGRAYMIYGAINHAARQGAQTAAVPACANCNGACTSSCKQCNWLSSSLPSDCVVAQTIDNSLVAAHLDPTQAMASTPSPTPLPCPEAVPEGGCTQASQYTVCRNMLLNQGQSSPPVCGVIISFQYPYQSVLPFTSLNKQTILLKAQVEMRGED